MKKKKLTCSDIPSLEIPKDWKCKNIDATGPFITKASLIRPDGTHYSWMSRFHRKHSNLLDNGTKSTWWAPGAIAWWIGVLFAIGATCFALGSTQAYISWTGIHTDSMTYFVGSIFFTTAAFLQYIETVNTRKTPSSVNFEEELKSLTWEPRRIDWIATAVQLIGTIFFNFSTFYAINIYMTAVQINHQVWAPDVGGSICFLIASALVWIEVGHGFFSFKLRNISWQIAILNLIGSVAFGISAVYAFVIPITGEPLNIIIQNLGTFIGGICFLLAAILLLPERTHPN